MKMKLVDTLLVIAVISSSRQLQADEVGDDVYLQSTWCTENSMKNSTECWRRNNAEIRGDSTLSHGTPFNVTWSKVSHLSLRKSVLDSVRRDFDVAVEDSEGIIRLRRAYNTGRAGKSGSGIEDWSKQLEAQEIIRVVSCQVDMSCSPVTSKSCRCPHGQAGCVVPRARVSQISRTRSGSLNMFCVGISLSDEEAGAQNPQTSCKYFSTDNAKYRVFATKIPELDPTSSGKPRIRYRACLKPMS